MKECSFYVVQKSRKTESTDKFIYTQAIGDYIQFVNNEHKLTLDTLFFGKPVYGQEDDFPDVTLPAVIENTNILLISPAVGRKNRCKTNHPLHQPYWLDT